MNRSMHKSFESTAPPVVECRNVSKRFYYDKYRANSLREWFIRRVLRKSIQVRRPEFTLHNLDLEVKRGEHVALVGLNGSGKSTALRLIAGIYKPSEGSIVVNGRIAAIIELGAGFHSELTGAENIAIYASVLGLSRREMAMRFEEIVDFSEMGNFLDIPIKYYSSGMETRLAFSVAVCVEPDILLLDEVLAVGDRMFQKRCLHRLRDYQAKGGTIILVSHQRDQVRELCSRAVWLDSGRVRLDSDVNSVLEAYDTAVNQVSSGDSNED